MPPLAAWYDLRDLGHYVTSLLDWLKDDLGAPGGAALGILGSIDIVVGEVDR